MIECLMRLMMMMAVLLVVVPHVSVSVGVTIGVFAVTALCQICVGQSKPVSSRLVLYGTVDDCYCRRCGFS